MADYVQKLRDDLVEQFKGKPVIDALMEAVGDELNEVRQFYEDLRDKRNIQTAVGKQLDGIGDNAVLTRLEAGALACAKESVYVLDDDAYRTYLIYKIWKNTNNCTYYDIIRAFKMFWDKPLHYREDPAIPATMIFETDALTPEADVSKLLLNHVSARYVGPSLHQLEKDARSVFQNCRIVKDFDVYDIPFKKGV